MRIDIPNARADARGSTPRHAPPRFTFYVDPEHPPSIIRADDGRGPAISLDWNQAVDDAGHLRHCPVCGCDDLYIRRTVPRLALFIGVVGAAFGAAVGYGVGDRLLGISVLTVVLVLDLVIAAVAERMLVCYRCRARFRGVPFRKRHRRWDANVQRHHENSTGSERADAHSASPAPTRTDAP